MAPDLVRELGLSASELGLLTAAYLATFALFQIPLGVLLDRYGPRRVQAALVAIGGIGAVLFAFGQNALTLTLARAIIGGLAVSVVLTVFIVPAAYLLVHGHDERQHSSRRIRLLPS